MNARNVVRLLLAAALVLTLAGSLAREAQPASRAVLPGDGGTIAKIAKLRSETNRWRRVMGLHPIRAEREGRELQAVGSHYRRWVLRLWRKRAEDSRRRARNPPRERAWLCIHRYEGPWNADTGNGYYGGLQMDLSFQRTYGARLLRAKGTANRWTPLEQMWVAVKAHRSGRGFHPWPNTARACGLL